MPPTITTQPPRFATADAAARIAAASRRTQQPQSRGDLVSLAMGEPDFDTPALVTEAAHASLSAGRTHYSPCSVNRHCARRSPRSSRASPECRSAPGTS